MSALLPADGRSSVYPCPSVGTGLSPLETEQTRVIVTRVYHTVESFPQELNSFISVSSATVASCAKSNSISFNKSYEIYNLDQSSILT